MRRRHAPLRDTRSHGYHDWRSMAVSVRGTAVTLCTKPGVAASEEVDAGARLLAEHSALDDGDTILDLNCSTGLAGAVAAMRAPGGRVLMADRNIVAVEAARRTLAANKIVNAAVYHSDGTSGLPLDAPADVALVRTPKEKPAALQLIWDAFNALRPGGRLYIAGAAGEGIKPFLQHTQELFGGVALLAYKHGARVGSARRPEVAPELPEAFRSAWLGHEVFVGFEAVVRDKRIRVHSRPGLFSFDRLDEGTRVLAEVMEIGGADTVLDLGCGNGLLGAVAGTLAVDGRVYMVDADVTALACARRTAEGNGLNNCLVLASDAAAAVADVRFDRVVTNPPFHTGKGTQYGVAVQFIHDAGAVLRPGGRLYLVANRFLPYESAVQDTFGGFETAFENQRYKVLRAVKAVR